MGRNQRGAEQLCGLMELYVAAKVVGLGEHGSNLKPEQTKALVVEALNLAQEVLNLRNAILADAHERDVGEANSTFPDTITKANVTDPSVELHEQTAEELQAEADAQAALDKDLAAGAAQTGEAPATPDTEPAPPPATTAQSEAPTDVNAAPAPLTPDAPTN